MVRSKASCALHTTDGVEAFLQISFADVAEIHPAYRFTKAIIRNIVVSQICFMYVDAVYAPRLLGVLRLL